MSDQTPQPDMTDMPEPGAGPSPTMPDGGPQGTVIERLKAQRAERLSKKKPLELPVPTWDGGLVATYGTVGEHDYNRFVSKLTPDTKPSLDQAIDIMIVACKAVTMHDPQSGEVTPLSSGYNRQLADALGVDGSRMRDLVLYLCDSDAWQIAEHAGEVIEYLRGKAQEVAAEQVGESESSCGSPPSSPPPASQAWTRSSAHATSSSC